MKTKTKKRNIRDSKTLGQRLLKYRKTLGQRLLKHRKSGLFCAFGISIFLALLIICINNAIICYASEATETHLIIFRGLLYSLSPLPLFFLLWFYRHSDTQENLSKQQQNLHQNALFEAQRLILEHDNSKKSVAIAQLKALLVGVPEFKKPIYIALKAGLQDHPDWKNKDTFRADLSDCDLHGIDLQGAILRGANLESTILQNANLSDVDFGNANLNRADLSNADLFDTNLFNVIFYEIETDGDGEEKKILTIDLQGASYNNNTSVPHFYDFSAPEFDDPRNEEMFDDGYPYSIMAPHPELS